MTSNPLKGKALEEYIAQKVEAGKKSWAARKKKGNKAMWKLSSKNKRNERGVFVKK